MKKILGINISHNCSFAYFENKILKEYYEEDRFNKIKNFEPNLPEYINYEYLVLKKFKNINFDLVVISTFGRSSPLKPFWDEEIVSCILSQLKYKKYIFNKKEHHMYHAVSGFYFSNFNKAIALISDGGGESVFNIILRSLQSIYLIDNYKVETKYKFLTNRRSIFLHQPVKKIHEYETKVENVEYTISNQKKAGFAYLDFMFDAGFRQFEEGQLMGIAAYVNKNTNLDKNTLKLANKAQEETFQHIVELIERSKKYSDCKNIILSGGYHLNCSNNFKLVKKYPKYNFFVDPISHDGGTAVGAAYYYANYI